MSAKQKSKKKENNNPNNKKYIKWFWILVFSGYVAVTLIFLLASWGAFGTLPTFEELENPESNLATEIISVDGKTIGKFYNENRTPVKFKDLPENLVEALVATEDERFYEHSGIDARSFFRAAIKLGSDGGGSTITQQLAKMLFTKRPGSSFKRLLQKIKEWVISIQLERQYTKTEILTMYLNKYDFLNQAVGIRSASRIYFGGKEPRDLKIEESATLVGMLKNSSLYNPRRREEMVKNRRNVVLKQMEKNDFIDTVLKDSLQAMDLGIDYTPEGHSEGMATYFREYLRDFMKKWAVNNPKGDGEKYNIYRDGLKIYTTIDSRMQSFAEEAVKAHMKNLQKAYFEESKNNKTAPFVDLKEGQEEKIMNRAKRRSERWRIMKAAGKSDKEILASFDIPTEMSVFTWNGDVDTTMTPNDSIRYYKHFLHAGLMSMEPQSGQVRAWVGGINNKHFKYDHVKQGKRQVGSTFKPFVYATAMDQLHLSPCDEFPNVPYTIEAGKFGSAKAWTPENSSNKYGGKLSLKAALANSVNVITARLMGEVGPQPVIDLARKLGVKSEIPYGPAIALGTPDLSVYEMVGAYGAFANQGVYIEPTMITSIEDKHGTVLYNVIPETTDVVSAESAYRIVNLMEGVTTDGSGKRLRWAGNTKNAFYKKMITGYPYAFNNPIAGKTGTTQNQSDGWFMGMVPNLVTGVWVGGQDRSIHFKKIREGQGATMALPIWGMYMKDCYRLKELEISKGKFPVPEGAEEYDCDNLKKKNDKKTDTEGDGINNKIEEEDNEEF